MASREIVMFAGASLDSFIRDRCATAMRLNRAEQVRNTQTPQPGRNLKNEALKKTGA
jgi:hypothetical protein